MHIRVLSEQDVRSVLTMGNAIDLQAEAFELLAEDQTVEGLRSFAHSSTPPGVAIFNPAFLKDGKGYGVKIVSDFYGNEARGLARLSSIITLLDGITGYPKTVMEGGYLTDIRTGAGTALAARFLARRDSKTIAMIGAGRVARNQLEALCLEHEIEEVLVSTRSPGRGEDFIRRMRGVTGVPNNIQLIDDRTQAVSAADMVVCATTSSEPVLPGNALKPGTFVVCAGAHNRNSREVDNAAVRRAAIHVIDSRRDCLPNAGDFHIPAVEGEFDISCVTELADLVTQALPARKSNADIALYKSMGVPIQDLITAQFVEQRAIDNSLGTLVDIGGGEI